VLHRPRGTRHIGSRVGRAKRALLGRREADFVGYMRAFQRSFRHMESASIDGLAVSEGFAGSAGDGARIMCIYKVKVVDVGVVDDVHVADKRVTDVDPLTESEA